MTAAAKRIGQEIRRLPLEDMLELHEELLASIDEKEASAPLDPEFQSEILRRVQEIDTGKVDGVEAFGALKDM